jgi:hypothetical protein
MNPFSLILEEIYMKKKLFFCRFSLKSFKPQLFSLSNTINESRITFKLVLEPLWCIATSDSMPKICKLISCFFILLDITTFQRLGPCGSTPEHFLPQKNPMFMVFWCQDSVAERGDPYTRPELSSISHSSHMQIGNFRFWVGFFLKIVTF